MRNKYRAITAREWCNRNNLSPKEELFGIALQRWRWCIANGTGTVRFGYKTRASARRAAKEMNFGDKSI